MLYNVVLVSAVQQSESVIHIHISTLFTTARTGKQPKCPSTEEWIKMLYIYTMEYYSAIKKNKIMPLAAAMDATRDYHTK